MSKLTHHPTTHILERKSYVTYQGYYRVKSKESQKIAIEEVFSRCIKHVIQWIEDRTFAKNREEGLAKLIDVSKSIDSASFYHDFYEQNAPFYYSNKTEYDIRIFSNSRDNEWTLSIAEPDNGKETKDFPGRIFVTDVALRMDDDNVYVAVKTECKDTKRNDSDSIAWRPAFLYYIYDDEELVMYEGGITVDDYPISENLIVLNTKSNSECENIYKNLIISPDRQMPIVLCPYSTDDEFQEKVRELAFKYAGMAYVVIESKQQDYQKLKLIDDKIRKGCFNYILPFSAGEKSYSYRSVGSSDANGIHRAAEIAKNYTVKRDGNHKKPAYQYGEVMFFRQLYIKYIQSIEKAADVEEMERLNNEIASLVKELEKLRDMEEVKEKYEEIQQLFVQQIDQIKNLQNKNEGLISIIDDKNTIIKDNKNSDKSLDDSKTEEELHIEDDKQEKILDKQRLDAVESEWNDKLPSKKSDVIKWINDNYSDTIYIHQDAKTAFSKKTSDSINLKKFCEAFEYLDSYVRLCNGNMSPKLYNEIKNATGFEATHHMFKGSKKDYPAYYVAIYEKDYSNDELLCDLHIKYSANSSGMFRIYFTYVPELKKAVVGSMPDHLCMGPNDNRGRSQKA